LPNDVRNFSALSKFETPRQKKPTLGAIFNHS
jgi:hypothetical protein